MAYDGRIGTPDLRAETRVAVGRTEIWIISRGPLGARSLPEVRASSYRSFRGRVKNDAPVGNRIDYEYLACKVHFSCFFFLFLSSRLPNPALLET